ncbi:hypothetical protein [Alicyclobacillus dauci]|uniref:Phage prohead protease, HK97 family n=1 Tax=Alicyclobacillus dauci TaxID=1475485 RepID=A0ABY6YWX0_9BACL|nr:hypothetical protein [Alicyclobacillus dauci]WAH35040.1 hypothetical protein NZD86_11945 [Alicyclobacillus dauci]
MKTGKPTPDQLSRINQLARTPLSEDEVYTFPAKLVGDKVIPHRSQRITPNALTKIADQAKQGVSLLLDHSWSNIGTLTIPVGRTFDAKVQQEPDGELAVYADHYMKRGQDINGVSTDSLADGIDAGTIFDTSVGFIGGDHSCSICGQPYYDSDCMHIRGRTYDGKLCVMEINDADLMENSLVFDGAYPGAGVVNMSSAESPEQKPTEYAVLSDTTKSLPGDGRVFYSFSSKSGLVGYVRQSAVEPERDDQVNELEQVKAQLSTAQAFSTKVRELLGVTSDDAVEGAVASLKAQAQVGEQYKAKVVDEACGAGVRALGEAFNVDAMKLSFANLPVSEVEKIRDTYEAQAKAALGGGGQHVVTQQHDLPEDAGKNPNGSTQLSAEQQREQARKDAREALKRNGHGDKLKEAN